MSFILIAVLVLGAIGLIAALVLYVCSKKFYVYEDPRSLSNCRVPTAVDVASLDVVAWLMPLLRVPMLAVLRD